MLLLAALLAGVAGPAPDLIQYRVAEALVVDNAGKPLFRAPREFLLSIAGNPDGRVLAYDPALRRVRVSEHQPWWIPCSQLQPQAVACSAVAAPAKPKTRSISLPGAIPPGDVAATPEARGVPSCPGDPRCPTGN